MGDGINAIARAGAGVVGHGRMRLPAMDRPLAASDPRDARIAGRPDPKLPRPEAISHAVMDRLTGRGYLRYAENPEAAQ